MVNTNSRKCESCGEWFDEEELDFIRIEGGDEILCCRNCEESIKWSCEK